jgi:hypothetical protein
MKLSGPEPFQFSSLQRSYQDNCITGKVHSGPGDEQSLAIDPVHVCLTGGSKDVHGGAALDLLRKRSGTSEVEDDLRSVLCLIEFSYVLKGVLKADCGRDSNLLCLVRGGCSDGK